MEILRASDRSFHVALSDQEKVHELRRAIQNGAVKGTTQCQAGYCSVLVHFDFLLRSSEEIEKDLRGLILSLKRNADVREKIESKWVEIPVCYDDPFAPDLKELAVSAKLPPAEYVRLHTEATYQVMFLGFMPGFAYLEGLNPKLAAPRLKSPRQAVPEGSLGIAGNQTGIYPQETPGGWRLIGRTPFKMFDPLREPLSLLAGGDRVRFRAISKTDFEKWNSM